MFHPINQAPVLNFTSRFLYFSQANKSFIENCYGGLVGIDYMVSKEKEKKKNRADRNLEEHGR